MLEMASGCCVRSPLGTAFAVREKTWEEARATQNVVCVSKHVDGSRLKLWFHAAYSPGNGGARSWIYAAESLSINRKCHREPIRAFISEQTMAATAATR